MERPSGVLRSEVNILCMKLPHLTRSEPHSWEPSRSRSRSRGHSATSPCWPSHRETLLLPNTEWSLQREEEEEDGKRHVISEKTQYGSVIILI